MTLWNAAEHVLSSCDPQTPNVCLASVSRTPAGLERRRSSALRGQESAKSWVIRAPTDLSDADLLGGFSELSLCTLDSLFKVLDVKMTDLRC